MCQSDSTVHLDLGAKSACILIKKKKHLPPLITLKVMIVRLHTTGVQGEMLLHNLYGLLNVCVVYLALLLVIRL